MNVKFYMPEFDSEQEFCDYFLNRNKSVTSTEIRMECLNLIQQMILMNLWTN